MNGFDQRFQNGFDCQGLWIEVGVERELGFNSKREVEAYGLAEFARRCREKVIWSAGELIRGSKRLGQWMDWGNDYYTFSDTNIEYIWRFLKLMHERGWLYKGRRSTEWCPRCGTSISRHELLQETSIGTGPTPRCSSASRSWTVRENQWWSGPPPHGRFPPTWRPRSTPRPNTS
jgi:isoleucyl-tRNA synthetase